MNSFTPNFFALYCLKYCWQIKLFLWSQKYFHAKFVYVWSVFSFPLFSVTQFVCLSRIVIMLFCLYFCLLVSLFLICHFASMDSLSLFTFILPNSEQMLFFLERDQCWWTSWHRKVTLLCLCIKMSTECPKIYRKSVLPLFNSV